MRATRLPKNRDEKGRWVSTGPKHALSLADSIEPSSLWLSRLAGMVWNRLDFDSSNKAKPWLWTHCNHA